MSRTASERPPARSRPPMRRRASEQAPRPSTGTYRRLVMAQAGAPAQSTAARVLALASGIDALPIDSFEDSVAAEALAELVPPVAALLDQTIELCRGLGGDADEGALADLGFIGAISLEPKRAGLRALGPAHQGWQIVEECQSARRRALRTLAALEGELAARESRVVHPSTAAVQSALTTRRVYAELRHSVPSEPFAAGEERMALLRVGHAIAVVVSHSIYPDLRLADRRLLRDIQRRILDWLRQPASDPEATRTQARRLHGEVLGVTQLLAQVRRREELVVHDRDLVEQLLTAPVGEPPIGIDAKLAELCGLDDDLDALLTSGEEIAEADWRRLVRRIGFGLGLAL